MRDEFMAVMCDGRHFVREMWTFYRINISLDCTSRNFNAIPQKALSLQHNHAYVIPSDEKMFCFIEVFKCKIIFEKRLQIAKVQFSYLIFVKQVWFIFKDDKMKTYFLYLTKQDKLHL